MKLNKKVLALGAAALMVVALAGCGSSAPANNASNNAAAPANNAAAPANNAAPSTGEKLVFTTGGESGTYYAVGGIIANDVTNNTGVEVTAVAGNGSQANVVALEDDEAQIAFCQSDVLSYAYAGTNLFEKNGAVKSFSIVAALYDETVQIVTTDPEIKTVADLKGKNVSIGAAGSGVYFNAIDVLGAYGLTEKDINPTYQSFGDSADAIKNGQIDAAFIVAGAPTTAIVDLSTSKDVYLVSLDDEHVAKLIEVSPYYSKSVIPADTYKGVAECTTVAVQAVVIANDSVSEGAIYAFTSDLYNNLEALGGSHAKFKEMSLEKGASIASVPYHPGAAKYFAEKNITVATK